MNKITFLIALLLSVGIWGCEDKEETPKDRYYDCETEKPIYKTLENEPATVQCGSFFSQKKTFVIMLENPKSPFPLYPCGNSLPKEYQAEGLKVKVSGICRECSPEPEPNEKIPPFFKINISSIKKVLK